MAVRSTPHEFAIEMDHQAQLSITGVGALDTPEGWTPEHLLLAAVSRCSAASLGFHATRAGLASTAEVHARCTVTRRDTDGRHAVTDVLLNITAEIAPAPSPAGLASLLSKAERDCFIGASLAIAPRYSWTVNGVHHPASG